ncbi:hypothetical protein BKA69DRAFT_1082444 [Paraphysoderma sedebokerense]|nr:hypothetical protein BKA69DRAFT_1082444 [Paraphysoderma sedebokerense]
MTLCYARGYKYAGLQNGMECWCGLSFGRYEKVNENECTKNCVGIETGNWTCGGKERNSVWEAGLFLVGMSPHL